MLNQKHDTLPMVSGRLQATEQHLQYERMGRKKSPSLGQLAIYILLLGRVVADRVIKGIVVAWENWSTKPR